MSQVKFAGEQHPDREERVERLARTGKYDRRAIKARLALEAFIDEELAKLYASEPPELDLDEIMEEDDDKARINLILNYLSGASDKDKLKAFAKELVKRLNEFMDQFTDLQAGPRKQRSSIDM